MKGFKAPMGEGVGHHGGVADGREVNHRGMKLRVPEAELRRIEQNRI